MDQFDDRRRQDRAFFANLLEALNTLP